MGAGWCVRADFGVKKSLLLTLQAPGLALTCSWRKTQALPLILTTSLPLFPLSPSYSLPPDPRPRPTLALSLTSTLALHLHLLFTPCRAPKSWWEEAEAPRCFS